MDLISRQAAIGAMLDNNCYRDSAGYAYVFVGDAVALLETLPSAQPERKKGKWIRLDKGNTFFVPHMLQCSECGNVLDKHGVNAGRGDANYCPNCGSDMRGEEE